MKHQIEDKCIFITNEPLTKFGMPAPKRPVTDLINLDFQCEPFFNMNELHHFVQINQPKLLPEQRTIYDKILHALVPEQDGFFFLDAPGGIGKPFLISLILAPQIHSQSQGNNALAIASPGIAALDGGRTAHSAFKLPLNIFKPMNMIGVTLNRIQAWQKSYNNVKLLYGMNVQ